MFLDDDMSVRLLYSCRIKRPNPLGDQDFTLMGAMKGSMNTSALLSKPRNQQQPSYADVKQGIRQEQSSAATEMQALLVMVESMQTMMNRMKTLIKALTLQLSATGIKKWLLTVFSLILFSSCCSSPDLVAIIYI